MSILKLLQSVCNILFLRDLHTAMPVIRQTPYNRELVLVLANQTLACNIFILTMQLFNLNHATIFTSVLPFYAASFPSNKQHHTLTIQLFLPHYTFSCSFFSLEYTIQHTRQHNTTPNRSFFEYSYRQHNTIHNPKS